MSTAVGHQSITISQKHDITHVCRGLVGSGDRNHPNRGFGDRISACSMLNSCSSIASKRSNGVWMQAVFWLKTDAGR